MCGIFGSISTAEPFDEKKIGMFEHALSKISYRGPDDQSFRLLSEGRVFLGHRRLSIIDLSNEANQPMECEGVWLVFNGEIFNYIEIKNELIKRGRKFKTSSDTEVILHTYLEYGADGFDRFNGMWAFLMYDSRKNIFLASRDRFSIKPLYYTQDSGVFYFASEIKQLLPFVREKSPNISVLKTLLVQRLQDHNNETCFQHILKVPPKSTLIVDLNTGTERIQKYWDYSQEPTFISENEALEKFMMLFEESVRIRLRSDVEIGCLLSGGLDSTAISITADKINTTPIQTFSVVSDDPRFSEEKYIDIAVQSGNLKNVKLSFDTEIAQSYIDQCLFHQDEPFAGASVIAQFMIYELIKKNTGIKVVLSGQGGDEILMGYLKYYFFNLRHNLKHHNYFAAMREVLLSLLHRTAIMQFEWAVAKRYVPGLYRAKQTVVPMVKADMEKVWDAPDLVARQKKDIDFYSVPALNHFEDRNSMAHSIESRVPFLDHNLVDFVVNLQSSLKYKNGWSKYLLRNSAINLPKAIRWRRDKKGFTVPERPWLEKIKSEVVNANNYNIMADFKLVDKPALMEKISGYYQGNKFSDPKELFSIYLANKWLTANFAN